MKTGGLPTHYGRNEEPANSINVPPHRPNRSFCTLQALQTGMKRCTDRSAEGTGHRTVALGDVSLSARAMRETVSLTKVGSPYHRRAAAPLLPRGCEAERPCTAELGATDEIRASGWSRTRRT